MLPAAIALSVGGATAMGVGACVQRELVKKEKPLFTEMEVLVSQSIISLAAMLLLLPLWLFFTNETLTPKNTTIFGFATVGIWLANVGVQTFDVYCRRLAPIKLTLPFQAMTPGLVAAGALLIGELPSIFGFFSIGFIMAGTYANARLGERTLKGYLMPLLKMLFLPRGLELLNKNNLQKAKDERLGVRLAFLSACCGTFGLLSEGIAARHGNPVVALSFAFMLLTLSSTVFWYLIDGLGIRKKRTDLPLFPR